MEISPCFWSQKAKRFSANITYLNRNNNYGNEEMSIENKKIEYLDLNLRLTRLDLFEHAYIMQLGILCNR